VFVLLFSMIGPVQAAKDAAASAPLAIEVVEGAVPAIRIKATRGSVLVPHCRGVLWQRFDATDQQFHAIPGAPCAPLASALSVDEQGQEVKAEVDFGDAQVVRAVVVVGTGCTVDRPFPLAACKVVTEVESTTISLPSPAPGK
jgi:hypothetical protein